MWHCNISLPTWARIEIVDLDSVHRRTWCCKALRNDWYASCTLSKWKKLASFYLLFPSIILYLRSVLFAQVRIRIDNAPDTQNTRIEDGRGNFFHKVRSPMATGSRTFRWTCVIIDRIAIYDWIREWFVALLNPCVLLHLIHRNQQYHSTYKDCPYFQLRSHFDKSIPLKFVALRVTTHFVLKRKVLLFDQAARLLESADDNSMKNSLKEWPSSDHILRRYEWDLDAPVTAYFSKWILLYSSQATTHQPITSISCRLLLLTQFGGSYTAI